jgi:hypothetical protein
MFAVLRTQAETAAGPLLPLILCDIPSATAGVEALALTRPQPTVQVCHNLKPFDCNLLWSFQVVVYRNAAETPLRRDPSLRCRSVIIVTACQIIRLSLTRPQPAVLVCQNFKPLSCIDQYKLLVAATIFIVAFNLSTYSGRCGCWMDCLSIFKSHY